MLVLEAKSTYLLEVSDRLILFKIHCRSWTSCFPDRLNGILMKGNLLELSALVGDEVFSDFTLCGLNVILIDVRGKF